MERIKLSKNEKRLLRNIGAGLDYWPDNISDQQISHSLASLENKGLILVAWSSGMYPVASELTDFGRVYLDSNPYLFNPVDWVKIGALAAIISALAMIAGLFIACSKF